MKVERKLNASIFHIVVNTNKHISNVDPEYMNDFYEGSIHVFKTNIFKYIEAYAGREEDNKHLREFIQSIDVTIAREIGKQDQKFHLDITVNIKHKTKLRFKQHMIREFFDNLNTYLYNKKKGDNMYHKCHIDIRGFADQAFYSKQYTEKGGDFESFNVDV